MAKGEYKTQFKWFTISQWMEEETYLREMHLAGWKFVSVTFPGFYRFVKTEPEDVIYKLDYNQDGLRNKAEYVQMFQDCDWEYLCDFVGYSYFRKSVKEGELAEDEDIYCDDESRLDMLKRVYKGRVIPLIVIFFCCIVPQLIMNFFRDTGESKVLFVMFFVLLIVYLALFLDFGIQYRKLKKRIEKI